MLEPTLTDPDSNCKDMANCSDTPPGPPLGNVEYLTYKMNLRLLSIDIVNISIDIHTKKGVSLISP